MCGFEKGIQSRVVDEMFSVMFMDQLRNRRIHRKRYLGERPFAVIKHVFGVRHVLVTTWKRVQVKLMFTC